MFHSKRGQSEDELRSLQSRVAELLKKAVADACDDHDIARLGLLLANCSELLAALKTDETLVSTSGGAQILIAECVEEAFGQLLFEAKQRLHPGLDAIIWHDRSV